MSQHRSWLAGAIVWLAALPAAAGSLQFWETSRGSEGVTAHFPTGPAQIAHIAFDASSAESGGLIFGASEIDIRAQGTMDFVAWSCELQGCNQNDYVFDPGTENSTRPGRVAVSDPNLDPESGTYSLGTITFNGPQQPGAMPLIGCNYTGLDYQEHSCSQFVLVTLPEPGPITALIAGALLLFGPLRRRARR